MDIGTTKIGAFIASHDATGAFSITGVASVPSRGVKKGVVVDVGETVDAIREAVNRASLMAGTRVEGVVAGVTGDHFSAFNRRGSVTVASRTGLVAPSDIERVLQAALLDVPRDREIVHALPRGFAVDGQSGIKQPVGLSGMRLEAETHVVTGKSAFLQNTIQCIERAGLRVEALVLESLATAEAVLSDDEREMGVLLVDIGGGTSDMAAWRGGALSFSSALPVGGHHVTRDIAIGLRTPFEWAEKLKIDSGAARRNLIPDGEALEVLMANGAEKLRIPRSLLGEITEARMSELFEIARGLLEEAGFVGSLRRHFGGGVVLSGGGALLPGVLELAEEIFALPARLGVPRNVSGWSDQVSTPQFATGVGLCQFALRQLRGNDWRVFSPLLTSRDGRRIWGALKPLQMPIPSEKAPLSTTSLPRQEAAQNFSAPRFEPSRGEKSSEKSSDASPIERLRRHDEKRHEERVSSSDKKENLEKIVAQNAPALKTPEIAPAPPNPAPTVENDKKTEAVSAWNRLVARLKAFIGFENAD